MAIPPEIRAAVETALDDFCRQHSSAIVAGELRYTYEITENAALLQVERPGFMNPGVWTKVAVAKFRYSETRRTWSLYWADTNERWHRLSSVEASKDLGVILQAVETDAAGVFWSR